jgi:Protein of unknown function (DUF3800)
VASDREFVCYLDDSDNDGGPMMGLAGFIAPRSTWPALEEALELYLGHKGVGVLRGKDFHHGHMEYTGWDGRQKSDFVDQLFSIVASYGVYGLSSVVCKSDYAELRAREKKFDYVAPLTMAFSSILGQIAFKDPPGLFMQNDIRYIFYVESGHKNNLNILRYFEDIKRASSVAADHLTSLSFIDKASCRAIQLADFLAFHIRRESESWYAQSFRSTELRGHALTLMMRHIGLRTDRLYVGQPPNSLPDDKVGYQLLNPNGLR